MMLALIQLCMMLSPTIAVSVHECYVGDSLFIAHDTDINVTRYDWSSNRNYCYLCEYYESSDNPPTNRLEDS